MTLGSAPGADNRLKPVIVDKEGSQGIQRARGGGWGEGCL